MKAKEEPANKPKHQEKRTLAQEISLKSRQEREEELRQERKDKERQETRKGKRTTVKIRRKTSQKGKGASQKPKGE